jgi:hypothetical protein
MQTKKLETRTREENQNITAVVAVMVLLRSSFTWDIDECRSTPGTVGHLSSILRHRCHSKMMIHSTINEKSCLA